MSCAESVYPGEVEHSDRVLSTCNSSQINHYVMLVIFFVPMVFIGFFEAVIDPNRNVWLREWVHGAVAADDTPDARDPKVTGKDAERGFVICKVPFAELIKEFPKTTMVCFQPPLTIKHRH